MKRHPTFKFSSRQQQIVQLWAELGSAAAVADRLNLSIYTVNTHLKRARSKAKVKKTWEVYHIIQQQKKHKR